MLNPLRNTNARISRSSSWRAAFSLTSPLRTAVSRVSCGSIPFPSSSTSMTTRPFFGVAVMEIFPFAGFPHRSRTSGGSIPWSMAFRRIWVSGSDIASATFRSISVLPPRTRISTFFPSSRARETAIGCRESNSGERGPSGWT